jgi:hypothetical protein
MTLATKSKCVRAGQVAGWRWLKAQKVPFFKGTKNAGFRCPRHPHFQFGLYASYNAARSCSKFWQWNGLCVDRTERVGLVATKRRIFKY